MRVLMIVAASTLTLVGSPSHSKTAAGKAAICQSDGPKAHCTFIPRNGDGSFTIVTSDGSYDFDKAGQDSMSVSFNNGARMVDQGIYTRSRDDRACWVQKGEGRFCVW